VRAHQHGSGGRVALDSKGQRSVRVLCHIYKQKHP
jgi:hypothetical protein